MCERSSQKLFLIILRLVSLCLVREFFRLILIFKLDEDKNDNYDSGDLVLGVDLFMCYFEVVGVNFVDYSLFVVCEIVKVMIIGEIIKEGFVEGWSEVI